MSDLLNLAGMAKHLGVSRSWLKEQSKAGNIPHLKAGTRLLFNPVAVQEALSTMAARTPKQSGGSK